MNGLTCDGASVNSGIGKIELETFTAQDVMSASIDGWKKGREDARIEYAEKMDILRHNLKTALLAMDGRYKLEEWQREILDKSAGGDDGNPTEAVLRNCGSAACGSCCNSTGKTGL